MHLIDESDKLHNDKCVVFFYLGYFKGTSRDTLEISNSWKCCDTYWINAMY